MIGVDRRKRKQKEANKLWVRSLFSPFSRRCCAAQWLARARSLAPRGRLKSASDGHAKAELVTISFRDVAGITPGDDDAYARVLIELWQNTDGGETTRRFLEERRVPAPPRNGCMTSARTMMLARPCWRILVSAKNASAKLRASSYRRLRSAARSATLAWHSPRCSTTRHSRGER